MSNCRRADEGKEDECLWVVTPLELTKLDTWLGGEEGLSRESNESSESKDRASDKEI